MRVPDEIGRALLQLTEFHRKICLQFVPVPFAAADVSLWLSGAEKSFVLAEEPISRCRKLLDEKGPCALKEGIMLLKESDGACEEAQRALEHAALLDGRLENICRAQFGGIDLFRQELGKTAVLFEKTKLQYEKYLSLESILGEIDV